MNMRNRILIISAAVLLAAGCGERKAERFQALPFPDVALPGMLTDAQDRAGYMAEHYWDAFADTSRTYPCDSLLVSGVRKDDVGQRFADWLSVLDMVGLSDAQKAVARLFDRAAACEAKDTASNVFDTFAELAEKYLYDPNSPFRNEDIYLPFVSRMASFKGISELQRGKYARDARLCSLNQGGTVAADFRFMDASGRMHTLHGIKAEHTLLFFSNPGCEACLEIINTLKGNPQISSMVASGRLAVVNVYIDEDITAWRDYMPVYPKEWYNGFDPDMVIRTDMLYSVRAIPSLYLLDAQKRVILKDAPEHKVFAALERM